MSYHSFGKEDTELDRKEGGEAGAVDKSIQNILPSI